MASMASAGSRPASNIEQRIAELRAELGGLKAERTQWERKLALVRGDVVDADILDEEARMVLGRAHRNDIVILTPPPPPARR